MSSPPHRSTPEGDRTKPSPVWAVILKVSSLLIVAGALGELVLGDLFTQRPAHEVAWQGPAEQRPAPEMPTPLAPEPKVPIQAQALRAPSAPLTPDQTGSTPTPAALPPLPSEPWLVADRGAITAPVSALAEQLSKDARWEMTGVGVWAREDAGATLAVTETRAGRITALTLTFGERGSSAIMPEIELLTLGGGSPSMTRWELSSSDRAQAVGGRLTQPLTEGGERGAYYLCDYGAASAGRTLPERCVFSWQPTEEALSMGEALRPAPRW